MKKVLLSIIISSFLFVCNIALADTAHQKEVKAIIDLNQGKANLLDLRLSAIKKTYDSYKEKGLNPVFVVIVSGDASNFMPRTDKYVSHVDTGLKKIMHSRINEMKRMGIEFKQCALSLSLLKISPDEIDSSIISIAENGYAELISYQNKGYALVPMD